VEKKKSKLYISNEVEKAIVDYCKNFDEMSYFERNKLFRTVIYPALDTLVSNLLYRGIKNKKPYYCENSYESLKIETITFLYEKLHKFNPDRGKAFSFLNRVASNYILAHSESTYNGLQSKTELSVVDFHLNTEDSKNEGVDDLEDFFYIWTKDCIRRIDVMYSNERDKKIADAILGLFENVKYLHIYNKKALLLIIKERVPYPTLYITNVLKDLKKNFKFKYKAYLKERNEKRKDI
jgi:hypothetical protein